MRFYRSSIFWIIVFIIGTYSNVFLTENISENLIVKPLYLIPFAATIYVLKFVRLKLVRYTIVIWLTYFIFGLIYTTQSCIKDSFWKLKINDPALIYGLYLFSFSLFCILFEHNSLKKRKLYTKVFYTRIPSAFIACFLLFPFVWLVSIIMSLGYLPIMSGIAFYESVYQINYGPLYGYVAYISVSVILTFSLYFRANNSTYKKFMLVLLLIFLFISFVDGKRYTILTSQIGLLVFYRVYLKKQISKSTGFVSVFVLLLVYVILHLTRVGQLNTHSIYESFNDFPIGVEFRDFVYSENNYEPGSIKGYDYTKSTISSLFNSSFLGFIGINKYELSHMGSAYAWEKIYFDLFNTEFGIRTGIISELYFAYSYWGILVFGIFSYILIKIAFVIEFKNFNLLHVIVFCVIYALFVMMIVGQTTAFVGQVMLLIYLLVFFNLYNKYIILK